MDDKRSGASATLLDLPNFCHSDCMSSKEPLVQLSSRGQVTLPSSVRRTLGQRSGDAFQIRIDEGNVVLMPVEVTSVEVYSEDRIAEFQRTAELSDEELARAGKAWDV